MGVAISSRNLLWKFAILQPSVSPELLISEACVVVVI
jgi:hypothetical protein